MLVFLVLSMDLDSPITCGRLLGGDETIIWQLFAFNVGLEVGQIIIVGLFLAISFIFVSLGGLSRRDWKMIISSAVAGIALMLMLDTQFLS